MKKQFVNVYDCVPSLRACITYSMNKSQQKKSDYLCIQHNTELDATFRDEVFLMQQELHSSIHASCDEAENHVCDDAYTMLQLMLLVFSVYGIAILAVETLQCCLRKLCNDRKGNRYNLLRSTLWLYISSKQKVWGSILLFGVLKALSVNVALLSLQTT